MSYEHVLVVCDGSSEAYRAVRAASQLAIRDHARLTVAAMAHVEPPSRGCQYGHRVWSDVLFDAAVADLERAREFVESPAHFTVLAGPLGTALADAERQLAFDVIVVPRRPGGRLGGLLRRDQAAQLRRHTERPVISLG